MNNTFLHKPIIHFIVGPHRSGTTYLQTLLASMPNVGTAPETHFFCRILPYLKELQSVEKRPIDFSDVKNAIVKIMFLGEDRVDFWDKAEKAFDKGGYRNLFICLLHEIALKNKCNISVLLEKTPSHLLYMNEIADFFPDAKFIIIIRDPRAIAVSLLKILSQLNQQERYGYLLKEIRYLKQFFCLIKQYQMNPSDSVKIIRYEDLTEKTDKVLKELCDFLDVDFDFSYRNNYYKIASNIILSGDIHKEQNTQQQKNFNLKPWEDLLSFNEKYLLEILMQDLLNHFKYIPSHRFSKVLLKILERLIEKWINTVPVFRFPSNSDSNSLIDKYIAFSPSMNKMK